MAGRRGALYRALYPAVIEPVHDGRVSHSVLFGVLSWRHKLSLSIDGFPVQVEVEGKAERLRAMIDRLKAIGAEPPKHSNTALPSSPTTDEAPICEFHGKMKQDNYGWFCPKKMGDGSYCKSKA